MRHSDLLCRLIEVDPALFSSRPRRVGPDTTDAILSRLDGHRCMDFKEPRDVACRDCIHPWIEVCNRRLHHPHGRRYVSSCEMLPHLPHTCFQSVLQAFPALHIVTALQQLLPSLLLPGRQRPTEESGAFVHVLGMDAV